MQQGSNELKKHTSGTQKKHKSLIELINEKKPTLNPNERDVEQNPTLYRLQTFVENEKRRNSSSYQQNSSSDLIPSNDGSNKRCKAERIGISVDKRKKPETKMELSESSSETHPTEDISQIKDQMTLLCHTLGQIKEFSSSFSNSFSGSSIEEKQQRQISPSSSGMIRKKKPKSDKSTRSGRKSTFSFDTTGNQTKTPPSSNCKSELSQPEQQEDVCESVKVGSKRSFADLQFCSSDNINPKRKKDTVGLDSKNQFKDNHCTTSVISHPPDRIEEPDDEEEEEEYQDFRKEYTQSLPCNRMEEELLLKSPFFDTHTKMNSSDPNLKPSRFKHSVKVDIKQTQSLPNHSYFSSCKKKSPHSTSKAHGTRQYFQFDTDRNQQSPRELSISGSSSLDDEQQLPHSQQQQPGGDNLMNISEWTSSVSPQIEAVLMELGYPDDVCFGCKTIDSRAQGKSHEWSKFLSMWEPEKPISQKIHIARSMEAYYEKYLRLPINSYYKEEILPEYNAATIYHHYTNHCSDTQEKLDNMIWIISDTLTRKMETSFYESRQIGDRTEVRVSDEMFQNTATTSKWISMMRSLFSIKDLLYKSRSNMSKQQGGQSSSGSVNYSGDSQSGAVVCQQLRTLVDNIPSTMF